MRNWVKLILKISAIVLIVGIALGALGFFLRKGEPFSLYFRDGKIVSVDGHDSIATLPKTTLDSFEEAEINMTYADVEIVATENEFAIEYELHGDEPEYEVKDGKLTFTQSTTNNNGFAVDFSGAQKFKGLIIYVPTESLSSIKIDSSHGDVIIGDLEVPSVELNLSYGDVELSNLKVDELLKISNSNGDVVETGCTFNNIEADLSYGDVEFVDAKITGNASFNNSYGDIEITLTNGEISYDLTTSSGDISVNGEFVSSGVSQSARNNASGDGFITASDSYGDIVINY